MNLQIKKSTIINILSIILQVVKVDKKMILFSSFNGQYNDSPKYLAEQIHEMDPSLKLVWIVSDKNNEKTIPKYLKIVKNNSIKYAIYINRSYVLVDNLLGIYSGTLNNEKTFIAFVKNIMKRKFTNHKHINVSTWHGTPLKRIGADAINSEINNENFFSTLNMMFAGSEYEKEIFERAFIHKFAVSVTGYPRNDMLFNYSSNNLDSLRMKLKLPQNKRIILYAPTYREDFSNTSSTLIFEMNLNSILNALSQKFGGEWVLVFRVHHNILKQINIGEVISKYGEQVVNGNEFDDMAEYLCVSDVLLTDYSSSIFDFAHTQKPCFLYCPDLDNYQNIQRGFYMNIRELPFPLAENCEELLQNITFFSESEYLQKVANLLRQIGSKSDGKASYRISKMIMSYLKGDENE